MLTKEERNHLKSIPASKKVRIFPSSPEAKKTGDLIVKGIKDKLAQC